MNQQDYSSYIHSTSERAQSGSERAQFGSWQAQSSNR